ncbi:MAG: hypothetical protein ACQEQF_00660 [Bacillota bacterium]
MKRLFKRSKSFVVIDRHISRVPKKLKELDEDYYILWNSTKERFEVHNDEQEGGSLAFVVGGNELDDRVIQKARETASHRAFKIIEELEAEYERKKRDEKKERREAVESRFGKIYDQIQNKPQVVVKK